MEYLENTLFFVNKMIKQTEDEIDRAQRNVLRESFAEISMEDSERMHSGEDFDQLCQALSGQYANKSRSLRQKIEELKEIQENFIKEQKKYDRLQKQGDCPF